MIFWYLAKLIYILIKGYFIKKQETVNDNHFPQNNNNEVISSRKQNNQYNHEENSSNLGHRKNENKSIVSDRNILGINSNNKKNI